MHLVCLALSFLLMSSPTLADMSHAPQLRVKTGISSLSVTAGNILNNQSLNSMITWQPTVVWDLPSFSSRLGVHYLQEMGGPYGLTPLSGVGVSGYYYFRGISSGYEISPDGVVVQKSRPGPYIIGSLTPVNLNMNRLEEKDTANNFYFSAFMTDIAMGAGYDYPILQNMLLTAEFMVRNGTTISSNTSSGNVSYSGWSIFIGFATAYY